MRHKTFPIFISYRHSDTADKAEHLLTLLEASGYKGLVSFDRENLDGRFDLEILWRLDHCKDFIVILGTHTMDSLKVEDAFWYQRLALCSENEFPAIEAEMKSCSVQLDFVRLEIARAIARGKNIIPIVPVNTSDYNFDRLELPVDIGLLIKQQAEKYQDTKDFLFKDILPKVQKHLTTRPRRFQWRWPAVMAVFVLIGALSIFCVRRYNAISIADLKGNGYAAINDAAGTGGADSIKVKWSEDCSFQQIREIKQIINRMMFVPEGKFMMGTAEPLGLETLPHPVFIEHSFYIGKFEVSEREWNIVLNDTSEGDEELPVRNVSWNDCQVFIRKLQQITGLVFTLPSEEQWEYAARYKEEQGWRYAGGNYPEELAAFVGNSDGVPQHRGKYKPNERELYDMSGNVAEWCSDGNADSPKQIIRGGSYEDDMNMITTTFSDAVSSDSRLPNVGMRLVLLI